MHKHNLAPRFKRLSTALLVFPFIVLLSLPVIADDHDWVEKRCEGIQGGLKTLETRAPDIREEIAEREKELEWLQSFQKGSGHIRLSTIINHVPLVTVAVIGSLPGMTPEFADVLVNRTGDLQSYVNQRETRVRVTELPRLREEQTDVGRRIFLLRDESKALNCSGDAPNGQSDLLDRIVGKWRASDTGNVIEIASGGDGILREVSGASASYGFSPGVTVLTNIRDVEGTLEAALTIRASKEDCPTLEPAPVRATIKFELGNRTFILTAPSRSYCINPCRWAAGEGVDFSRTYSRIE